MHQIIFHQQPFAFSTAVCHSLQHPGNGSVNVSSYFFGDTAHFSCDTGYELLGHSDRRCESNKLWSGAQPICKSKLQ